MAAPKKNASSNFERSLNKLADRAAAWNDSAKADKAFAQVKIQVSRASNGIEKISKIDSDLLRKRVTL
jgi:hypothetical protein